MPKYYNHKCACGCGEKIIIQKHHKYYGIPKYVRFHYHDDGAKNRKYILNEQIFDNLTSESAYWLGFIYADGNISNHHRLRIALQLRDQYVLEKFNKFLESSYPIKFKEQNKFKQALLEISSEHIVKRLNELGVYPCKTKILTFPNFLPKDLLSHFIRGFFDGDGSLYCWRGKLSYISFTLASTKQFLLKAQEILMKECSLNKTKLKPDKNSFVLKYSGRQQVKRIISFLLKDARFCLSRKLPYYQELLT